MQQNNAKLVFSQKRFFGFKLRLALLHRHAWVTARVRSQLNFAFAKLSESTFNEFNKVDIILILRAPLYTKIVAGNL